MPLNNVVQDVSSTGINRLFETYPMAVEGKIIIKTCHYIMQTNSCKSNRVHFFVHETTVPNENKDFLKMKYNQGMQMLSNTASTYDKNGMLPLHCLVAWYDCLKKNACNFCFNTFRSCI